MSHSAHQQMKALFTPMLIGSRSVAIDAYNARNVYLQDNRNATLSPWVYVRESKRGVLVSMISRLEPGFKSSSVSEFSQPEMIEKLENVMQAIYDAKPLRPAGRMTEDEKNICVENLLCEQVHNEVFTSPVEVSKEVEKVFKKVVALKKGFNLSTFWGPANGIMGVINDVSMFAEDLEERFGPLRNWQGMDKKSYIRALPHLGADDGAILVLQAFASRQAVTKDDDPRVTFESLVPFIKDHPEQWAGLTNTLKFPEGIRKPWIQGKLVENEETKAKESDPPPRIHRHQPSPSGFLQASNRVERLGTFTSRLNEPSTTRSGPRFQQMGNTPDSSERFGRSPFPQGNNQSSSGNLASRLTQTDTPYPSRPTPYTPAPARHAAPPMIQPNAPQKSNHQAAVNMLTVNMVGDELPHAVRLRICGSMMEFYAMMDTGCANVSCIPKNVIKTLDGFVKMVPIPASFQVRGVGGLVTVDSIARIAIDAPLKGQRKNLMVDFLVSEDFKVTLVGSHFVELMGSNVYDAFEPDSVRVVAPKLQTKVALPTGDPSEWDIEKDYPSLFPNSSSPPLVAVVLEQPTNAEMPALGEFDLNRHGILEQRLASPIADEQPLLTPPVEDQPRPLDLASAFCGSSALEQLLWNPPLIATVANEPQSLDLVLANSQATLPNLAASSIFNANDMPPLGELELDRPDPRSQCQRERDAWMCGLWMVDASDDNEAELARQLEEERTGYEVRGNGLPDFASPQERNPDPDDNVPILMATVDASLLNSDQVERLEKLAKRHKGIFVRVLEDRPPLNVTPAQETLTTEPRLALKHTHHSRASPLASEHVDTFFTIMQEKGMVSKAIGPLWSSAALTVKKPDGSLRVVIDLRPVNAITAPQSCPAVDIPRALHSWSSAEFFAVLDLKDAFWQLPLAKESQPIFAIWTTRHVVVPARVLQGSRNATSFLYNAMFEILGPKLYNGVVNVVDDLVVSGKTFDEFLDNLEYVLDRLSAAGAQMALLKTKLCVAEFDWCGHRVNRSGWKVNPRGKASLLNMPPPTNAKELQFFLSAVNFCRSGFPNYTMTVEPLQELLLASTREAGSAKATKLARVPLALNDIQLESFETVKHTLEDLPKLAHVDLTKEMCLITDASDKNWGAVLTQVDEGELDLPFEQQTHHPLMFASGKFTSAQQNWQIAEREAYPIYYMFKYESHQFDRSGRKLHLFTDHRNLIFVLDPSSRPTLIKSSVSRLERWALEIQQYSYDIRHIPGEQNILADLLSRGWNKFDPTPVADSLTSNVVLNAIVAPVEMPPLGEFDLNRHAIVEHGPVVQTADAEFWEDLVSRDSIKARVECAQPMANSLSHRSNSSDPVSNVELNVVYEHGLDTLTADDWVGPTRQSIALASYKEFPPNIRDCKWTQDGLWMVNARIYVPKADDLRVRVFATAHVGMGHRGINTTLDLIKAKYVWETVESDVRMWIKDCLWCQVSDPSVMQRTFGTPIHAQDRNEVVSFDIAYMDESLDGYKYIVLIRDELTKYTLLIPTMDMLATSSALAILKWIGLFGPPDVWVSDQGSQFTSQTLEVVRATFGIKHHLTTAHSPWTHGMVERAIGDMRQLFRVVLAERRLGPKWWPQAADYVTMLLNNSPSKTLDGFTPLYLFTGLEPFNPLDVYYHQPTACMKEVDHSPSVRLMAIELQDRLSRDIDRVKTKQDLMRESRDLRRQAKPHVLPVDFTVGDFVLVFVENVNSKQAPTWFGPAEVVSQLSPLVFEVRSLARPTEILVRHASRLRRFADADLNTTVNFTPIARFLEDYDGDFVVERISDIRKVKNILQLKVHWLGFDESSDSWEPAKIMLQDVPIEVSRFLEEAKSIDGAPARLKWLDALETLIKEKSLRG